jgi:hypothetical protein
MAEWHVRRGDRTLGPFDDAALRSMAKKGKLQETDLIQRSGSEKWVSPSKVKGLLDAPATREPAERFVASPAVKASAPEPNTASEAATIEVAAGAVETPMRDLKKAAEHSASVAEVARPSFWERYRELVRARVVPWKWAILAGVGLTFGPMALNILFRTGPGALIETFTHPGVIVTSLPLAIPSVLIGAFTVRLAFIFFPIVAPVAAIALTALLLYAVGMIGGPQAAGVLLWCWSYLLVRVWLGYMRGGDFAAINCATCGGRGQVEERHGDGRSYYTTTCPSCAGSGMLTALQMTVHRTVFILGGAALCALIGWVLIRQ